MLGRASSVDSFTRASGGDTFTRASSLDSFTRASGGEAPPLDALDLVAQVRIAGDTAGRTDGSLALLGRRASAIGRERAAAEGAISLVMPRSHLGIVEDVAVTDAFVAGFLAAHCRGLSPSQARHTPRVIASHPSLHTARVTPLASHPSRHTPRVTPFASQPALHTLSLLAGAALGARRHVPRHARARWRGRAELDAVG